MKLSTAILIGTAAYLLTRPRSKAGMQGLGIHPSVIKEWCNAYGMPKGSARDNAMKTWAARARRNDPKGCPELNASKTDCDPSMWMHCRGISQAPAPQNPFSIATGTPSYPQGVPRWSTMQQRNKWFRNKLRDVARSKGRKSPDFAYWRDMAKGRIPLPTGGAAYA